MLTGSQPAAAGNPWVLHPGLLPVVTSVNAPPAAAGPYKKGFKNPNGGFPSASNLSFTSVIVAAKIGSEHNELETAPSWFWKTTSMSFPMAEASGKPRPVRLNFPALVLPM